MVPGLPEQTRSQGAYLAARTSTRAPAAFPKTPCQTDSSPSTAPRCSKRVYSKAPQRVLRLQHPWGLCFALRQCRFVGFSPSATCNGTFLSFAERECKGKMEIHQHLNNFCLHQCYRAVDSRPSGNPAEPQLLPDPQLRKPKCSAVPKQVKESKGKLICRV